MLLRILRFGALRVVDVDGAARRHHRRRRERVGLGAAEDVRCRRRLAPAAVSRDARRPARHGARQGRDALADRRGAGPAGERGPRAVGRSARGRAARPAGARASGACGRRPGSRARQPVEAHRLHQAAPADDLRAAVDAGRQSAHSHAVDAHPHGAGGGRVRRHRRPRHHRGPGRADRRRHRGRARRGRGRQHRRPIPSSAWSCRRARRCASSRATSASSCSSPRRKRTSTRWAAWCSRCVGRVPARGELIRHPAGLEFEVLDADPRRVKKLARPSTRAAARRPPPRPRLDGRRRLTRAISRAAESAGRSPVKEPMRAGRVDRGACRARAGLRGWRRRAARVRGGRRCPCWPWRRSSPGRCCGSRCPRWCG